MTRTLIEVGVLLTLVVGALFGYGEFRERLAQKDAERERLETLVGQKDAQVASVDSAARLRVANLQASMDSLERKASRLDTLLVAQTDTVLRLIPEPFRPAVESLVATCNERIAVCEERADSLTSVVFTREGQLAARDTSLAAKDSLISELQDQLDPGFFDSLFGDLPGTAAKVGVGILVGFVLSGG